MDHMLVVYYILFVVSLWGGYIFAEGVWRKGFANTSAVYIYVLVLFWGFCVILGINIISRQHVLTGNTDLLHSWCWPYRWYVTGSGIIAIVGHMTYRRYFEERK